MYKFLFVLFLLLSSCGGGNGDNAIVDKSKMAQVLEDIYLLENHYQMKYGTPSLYKPYLDSSCMLILAHHGLTKEAFLLSFDYYSARPEDFIEIQNTIKSSLSNRK